METLKALVSLEKSIMKSAISVNLRNVVERFTELAIMYYRLLLILGLAFFIFIDLFFVMPRDKDLGVNLLTDSVFTIFTIIFLMALIEFRENHQWKLVEDRVMRSIGFRLQKVLGDLIPLCKGLDMSYERTLVEIKDKHGKGFLKAYLPNYSQVLEELSRRVELNENTRKKMLKGEMGSLERSLEDHIQALSDLQVQHFKFLDAELISTLMQIQENLRLVRMNMRPLADSSRLPADRRARIMNGLFEVTGMRIRDTMKEIYKLDKKGEVPISIEQEAIEEIVEFIDKVTGTREDMRVQSLPE